MFVENGHAQYDVAILAIGDAGIGTLQKYRHPTYGKSHHPIKIVKVPYESVTQYQQFLEEKVLEGTLCDSKRDGDAVFDVIVQTGKLFVVGDMADKLVCDAVLYYMKFRRNYGAGNQYTVIVDRSLMKHQNDTLLSWSDLIISNREPDNAYRPIEMILSDMQTQFVGIDPDDVSAILAVTPKLSYLEAWTDENTELDVVVTRLERKIKDEQSAGDVFHAFLYVSIPNSLDLGALDYIYKRLSESAINGEIIFQIGFRADTNTPDIQIALLYGREAVV